MEGLIFVKAQPDGNRKERNNSRQEAKREPGEASAGKANDALINKKGILGGERRGGDLTATDQ